MTEKQQRVCPFTRGFSGSKSTFCVGKNCACYVRVVKPAFITKEIVDSENFYAYEGCGLIRVTAWNLLRRPRKDNQQ
jgi:hypothetical protein